MVEAVEPVKSSKEAVEQLLDFIVKQTERNEEVRTVSYKMKDRINSALRSLNIRPVL